MLSPVQLCDNLTQLLDKWFEKRFCLVYRKFYQDLISATMSRLFLSSNVSSQILGNIDIPEMVSDGREHLHISVCESFIKICHQEPCQDSTCPPSLFQVSRRTWTFLMNLEMVSDGREHPSEVSVKVSSRSDIRNNAKTPPVLQVSLGGHGHS